MRPASVMLTYRSYAQRQAFLDQPLFQCEGEWGLA